MPATLPDAPQVRQDLLDYYAEAARFEKTVATVAKELKKAGKLNNTLIVVTGDNGMPFPRAKANLYDAGTRVPLIICGLGFIGGKRISAPVSLVDLAATFLQVAGLKKGAGMLGSSLARFLVPEPPKHQSVFIERERHAYVRAGNLSYPARGIRTKDYLYLQNLMPDRWPAGDPAAVMSVGAHGDIDNGPTKSLLIDHKQHYAELFAQAMAKRPLEELYDLKTDPNQLHNVANLHAYKQVKEELSKQLTSWRKRTKDPRLTNLGEIIDNYPYYGVSK